MTFIKEMERHRTDENSVQYRNQISDEALHWAVAMISYRGRRARESATLNVTACNCLATRSVIIYWNTRATRKNCTTSPQKYPKMRSSDSEGKMRCDSTHDQIEAITSLVRPQTAWRSAMIVRRAHNDNKVHLTAYHAEVHCQVTTTLIARANLPTRVLSPTSLDDRGPMTWRTAWGFLTDWSASYP